MSDREHSGNGHVKPNGADRSKTGSVSHRFNSSREPREALGSLLGWAALGSVVCAAAYLTLRSREEYRPENKVVLITGGARGLGLALAREFSDSGSIVAVCSRNEDQLSRAQSEFDSQRRRFLAVRCDLRDPEQVALMVRTVEEKFGPIDVLVNNAGTIQVGPLENQRVSDFEEAMQSNFWSAVHATFAVLPVMRRRRSGKIVNIASIGGKIAVPRLLPYSASKFALLGFSRGLRAELAKDGLSVTTVVPGLMRTGSPRNIETVGRHAGEYSWFKLSDSLPGISMNSQEAAKKIVEACAADSAEVVLGAPAQVMTLLDAVAPSLVANIMAAVNEWALPGAGAGSFPKKGFQSESWFTKSFLTLLTRYAEMQNNEA